MTDEIYDYCRMRLDNGAAVVRFKFSSQKAYEEAYVSLIENNEARRIADTILGFISWSRRVPLWRASGFIHVLLYVLRNRKEIK